MKIIIIIRLKLKSLRFHKGNIATLAIQTYMPCTIKTVNCPSKNQQNVNSSHGGCQG